MEVDRVALGWLLHGLDLRDAYQRLQYSSAA